VTSNPAPSGLSALGAVDALLGVGVQPVEAVVRAVQIAIGRDINSDAPVLVEVLNRDGTAEIYFTVDGTEPTVGGTGCEVLPAAMGSIVVAAPNAPGAGGGTVVKCISTGTPKVSVKGL
jgi:hypothetical protein